MCRVVEYTVQDLVWTLLLLHKIVIPKAPRVMAQRDRLPKSASVTWFTKGETREKMDGNRFTRAADEEQLEPKLGNKLHGQGRRVRPEK